MFVFLFEEIGAHKTSRSAAGFFSAGEFQGEQNRCKISIFLNSTTLVPDEFEHVFI